MSNTRKKTQTLAICGVLSALTVIVSFLPLRTLGLEITFSMVPVAVTAALYGSGAGAILGGVFGITSFLQCFGYSPFGAMLLDLNPLYTFIICVPTRILAGALAGILANIFKKNSVAYLIGSIAAPVFNTLFFMTTLCLCFYNTPEIQNYVVALGALNPITFVLLFVGVNGLVEIIAGAAVAYPATMAAGKLKR